jgi:hypothetical protein
MLGASGVLTAGGTTPLKFPLHTHNTTQEIPNISATAEKYGLERITLGK